MRRAELFSSFILLVLLVLIDGAACAKSATLALTHITVIDATGRQPLPDRTVLLSGDRIESIDQAAPPDDARIIDGRGKFLIPGLCDMHVHLAGVTADPKWSKATLLPLLIANGVTTVRDMGGDLAALQSWRKEIDAGKLIGPRIYCPGPMLDGGKSDPPALLGISSPDEGRAAVRDLKSKGADFIKVLSRLDRESYFAIADEAKKQGMTFVGHVPNSIRAVEASRNRSEKHRTYLLQQPDLRLFRARNGAAQEISRRARKTRQCRSGRGARRSERQFQPGKSRRTLANIGAQQDLGRADAGRHSCHRAATRVSAAQSTGTRLSPADSARELVA